MDVQSGPNVAEFHSARGHHQPVRPSWKCDTDGQDWPCVPAREHMLTTWTDLPRSMTMAGYFIEACNDLTGMSGGELYRRFLSWIRP